MLHATTMYATAKITAFYRWSFASIIIIFVLLKIKVANGENDIILMEQNEEANNQKTVPRVTVQEFQVDVTKTSSYGPYT